MSDKYKIREYGAGAFLFRNDDDLIADFDSHLAAEEVIRLIELGQKYEFLDEPVRPWEYEGDEPVIWSEDYGDDEPEGWYRGDLIIP